MLLDEREIAQNLAPDVVHRANPGLRPCAPASRVAPADRRARTLRQGQRLLSIARDRDLQLVEEALPSVGVHAPIIAESLEAHVELLPESSAHLLAPIGILQPIGVHVTQIRHDALAWLPVQAA